MNESWIKLFRKFREWGWYGNGIVKDVFLELLLTANFEDKEWNGLLIKRGQTITGRKQLAEMLGFSEQNIRTALTKLKSTNEVTIKSYSKFSVITINKYNDYQEVTSSLTNNQPATNQQLTTPKEYKNIRNIIDKSIITPKEFGNEKINLIIKTFKKYKGMLPIDKRIRNEAYNLSRRIDTFNKKRNKPTDINNFSTVLEQLFSKLSEKDYFESIEKLEAIRLRAISLFDQALEVKTKNE